MEYKDLRRETIIVLLVITVALSFWSGAKYSQWRLASEPVQFDLGEAKTDEKITEAPQTQEILVHVAGAVNNPGVYALVQGARVEDVLKLAIPREDAAVDEYLNRAAVLQDSDKIYIPSKEEVSQGEEKGDLLLSGNVGSSNKININKATQKELETLAGIGSTRAQAIINYRNNNGHFKNPEGVLEVSGIGPGIYENIKDSITVH